MRCPAARVDRPVSAAAVFRLRDPGGATTLARSVNADLPSFSARLEDIRARIATAAVRSGRLPGAVTLIAVVKSVAIEAVREAVAAGVTDLGENRVQEADAKIAGLGSGSARWHMVGPLQRNKAGRAVELFDRIQSVSDLDLAERLSRRALAAGRVLPVLVQVNVSGETTKHGIEPDRLEPLLHGMLELPGIRVDGLMSIGRPVADANEARPEFVRTRELRAAAERAVGVRLPELSMGMSGDFETAIEEGSTMVRLGTVLFGPRR